MAAKPQILSRQTAYDGYLTVERLRLRLADGSEAVREVESHGDAVAVLAFDPDRRCATTVSLLRAPVLETTGETSNEEACAGMVEDGEDVQDAMRREAQEELGVSLRGLERIGHVWTSPGVSTERVTLFIAPYSLEDRSGPGGGVDEEHEDITVHERSLAQLAADSDEGRIADAKLLTLVLALRLRRPELFDARRTEDAGAHG